MCADCRRAVMDVLEKREEQVSLSREGERVKAERWKSCVAVGMESFSNSKQFQTKLI